MFYAGVVKNIGEINYPRVPVKFYKIQTSVMKLERKGNVTC